MFSTVLLRKCYKYVFIVFQFFGLLLAALNLSMIDQDPDLGSKEFECFDAHRVSTKRAVLYGAIYEENIFTDTSYIV